MTADRVIIPGMPPCRLEDWYADEPMGRVRWRHSHLTDEVEKLWDAQSFMTWRYGVYFNTHIVVMARPLGIVDHREFAALVPKFNKEMARWLAVSGANRRGRWCKRMKPSQPNPHLWMYVFERSARRGLHLHQLCVVPKALKAAFAAHARDWWERAACLDVERSAIFVSHRSREGADGLFRHAAMVRYLLKSAHPGHGLKNKQTGECRSWAQILGLKPAGNTPPVYVPQMVGICRAISASAQAESIEIEGEEVRFCSKLWQPDLNGLFDGSEYADYLARQQRPKHGDDRYLPLQSLLL